MAQHAVPWRKQHEDAHHQRAHDRDHTGTADAVGESEDLRPQRGQPVPADRSDTRQQHADQDLRDQTIREQAGADRGPDHHRDDEDRADGLERRHRRQRHDHHEQVVHQSRADPLCRGQLRIERRDAEFLEQQHDEPAAQHKRSSQDPQLTRDEPKRRGTEECVPLRRGQPGHVLGLPVEDAVGVEIHMAHRRLLQQQHAQRKQHAEDHAHRRPGIHSPYAAHHLDEQDRNHPGPRGTKKHHERLTRLRHQERHDQPRQHAVADRVAHQRLTPEHEEVAQQGAGHGGQ